MEHYLGCNYVFVVLPEKLGFKATHRDLAEIQNRIPTPRVADDFARAHPRTPNVSKCGEYPK